jgi:hypothetical protein
MNEAKQRIKQLADEAYALCGKHSNDYNGPAFTEKFAELIIRASVGVADDYVKDCTCEEHINCKHPRSAIGRKIREHFGVEQ